jgi:hypothetical protein
MNHRQGENRNDDNTRHLTLNHESWLKTEFQKNFNHLRDRDSKIIEIVKFYVTVVLGVATASIALMGLKDLSNAFALVGLLLIATCVVGEICLLWIIAFRRYFVTCARQINAIRHLYVENSPPQYRESILQPTDPSLPPMLHTGSAQIIVMIIIIFINAILFALGVLGVTSYMAQIKSEHRILVSVFAFLSIAGLNTIYMRKKLKENKNDN